MSVINVQCLDQTLTVTNSPKIASGGILEDSVTFTFCSQWTGYVKTAVFWKSEDDTYYSELDENNTCIIPEEVLAKDGTMYFGVFGIAGNVTRTSEVVKYQIVKGAIVSDESNQQDVPDPTPSVYARLLASYDEVHQACLALDDEKADKIPAAPAGNIMVFDALGNIADGGSSLSDVALSLNVPGLPAATNAANEDLIAISNGGTLKKLTFSNLVTAIKTAIGNFFAKTETYTAEVPSTGWGATAPYSQTVAVTGVLATDAPIPGVVYGSNDETNAAIKEAWACVDRITTADGSITLTCFDDAPATDFSVNLKVVR